MQILNFQVALCINGVFFCREACTPNTPNNSKISMGTPNSFFFSFFFLFFFIFSYLNLTDVSFILWKYWLNFISGIYWKREKLLAICHCFYQYGNYGNQYLWNFFENYIFVGLLHKCSWWTFLSITLLFSLCPHSSVVVT